MTRFLDFLTGFLLSKGRIDHNPTYMCLMVWDLFAGSFAVVIGLPDTAMTHMTWFASHLICWLMFLGGLACVWGIVMGTKCDPGYWIRPWFGKTNIVDIRIPYLFGILGCPMLMVSFFYYSVAILTQMSWQPTMASEASLAMTVGVASTLSLLRLCLEIRAINARLPGLIHEEVQIQERQAQKDERGDFDG